jgi:hypothetical protein
VQRASVEAGMDGAGVQLDSAHACEDLRFDDNRQFPDRNGRLLDSTDPPVIHDIGLAGTGGCVSARRAHLALQSPRRATALPR